MTSRERLLCALNHGKPDRVPVAPDITFMYPAKYSGRPYWDLFLYSDPPVWQVTADLAARFGFDAMIVVGLDANPADEESESVEILESSDSCLLARHTYHTAKGSLTKTVYYPVAASAWTKEPLIKDPEADYPKLMAMLGDPAEKRSQTFRRAKAYLGTRGLVGDYAGVPTFYWCSARGKIADAIMDFYDYPKLVERFVSDYSDWVLAYIKASIEKAAPDFFMFGGSYASMSLISPDFYRKHNLPLVQQATELLKKNLLPSCLHMCGKSNQMVGVFAAETQLDLLEPLVRPPGGDVCLRDIKERYGHRLCLKGNVNTFDTLARGTPEQVEDEARRCIEDAAEGGGFILASGDQVPGDTSEDNFKALVGAALKYGVY